MLEWLLCVVVDGGWTSWQSWAQCSVTCGLGTVTRTRTCSNPEPSCGGGPCEGEDTRVFECDAGPCTTEGPTTGAPTTGRQELTTQEGEKLFIVLEINSRVFFFIVTVCGLWLLQTLSVCVCVCLYVNLSRFYGLYLAYYESDFDQTWWKCWNFGLINCFKIS